jgi:MerR family mercuric resistance operon transcriptional regulator
MEDRRMSEQISIGAAAERTGVKTETIRFYEREGLIPAPLRTDGGHRVYDSNRVERLAFIHRARELGFPLDQVRSLFQLVDEPGHSCGEVGELAGNHLQTVQARIADLRAMEKVLQGMVSSCSGGTVPDCPIIGTLQPAT